MLHGMLGQSPKVKLTCLYLYYTILVQFKIWCSLLIVAATFSYSGLLVNNYVLVMGPLPLG